MRNESAVCRLSITTERIPIQTRVIAAGVTVQEKGPMDGVHRPGLDLLAAGPAGDDVPEYTQNSSRLQFSSTRAGEPGL